MTAEYLQGGYYIERGVEVPGPYDHTKGEETTFPVDRVTCPALGADWYYEFDPGITEQEVLTAMRLYHWGITKGIEIGKKQQQDEIRKALGLPETPK